MLFRSVVLTSCFFFFSFWQLSYVVNGLPSHRSKREPANGTSSSSEQGKKTGRKDTRILSHQFKPFIPNTNRFEEESTHASEIVFPSSVEDQNSFFNPSSIQSPMLISRTQTNGCKHTGNLCENVENYPDSQINNILAGLGELRKLAFGKDEDKVDIANRNTNELEDNSFCVSVRKTIFPQLGITRDNQQKYIVNLVGYSNLTQGVLVETCRHENKKCDIISDGYLPDHYETKCTQKYIYRRLISYDGLRIGQDSFLVPSACCCTYKKKFLEARSAFPKDDKKNTSVKSTNNSKGT